MPRRRDLMPAGTSSAASTAPLAPRITPTLEQARNRGIAHMTKSLSSSTPSASTTSPYVEHGPSHSTTDGPYSEATDETFTTGTSVDNRTNLTPFLRQSFPDLSLDRPSMAGLPSDLQQESMPDKEDLNLPPHKVCSILLATPCLAFADDFQFNWEHQGDCCFRSRRTLNSQYLYRTIVMACNMLGARDRMGFSANRSGGLCYSCTKDPRRHHETLES